MKSVRSRGRDMADEAGWNEPSFDIVLAPRVSLRGWR